MTRALGIWLAGWLGALLLGGGAAWAAGSPACAPAWGVALEGYPVTPARLAACREETGLAPRLVLFYLQWPAPGEVQAFPRASLEAITEAGAVPCLTWEPMYLGPAGQETAITLADLLAGGYDAYLRDFARAAAAWGRPLLVRLGHEMNLARYHWAVAPEAYGPESPAAFQRFHRRVVELCRREGAGNLRWVFCPNAESNPHPRWHGAAWNTAAAYYPGDDFVDVLGMDGYNWGTTQTRQRHGWQSRWQGFAEIFGELRRELLDLAPDKPLMICETASAALGGDRAAWIAEALAVGTGWGLKGMIWFQVAKETDWRLRRGHDDAALLRLGRAAACPPGEFLGGQGRPAQLFPDKRK